MDRLIPLIIALSLLAFWAWMFWDLTNNDELPSNAKWNWTLALVFLNIFAAVFYYFDQYRNRH